MLMVAQTPYELDPEFALWRSNVRLPKWTEDHIRVLAVDTKTEIEQLDNEISKTRALLARLLDRHNQKTERLAFLRGAISPLKQIPPELLGEIFVLCGEGKPTVLPPNYSSQPRYPWTLGQVSSYWRKVLRSTPDVWRNLEVGMISSKNDLTIDVARDIFSRVDGGLTLSTRGEVDLKNPIGPFILGCVDRLRHLTIEPTHAFLSAFLGLPSGSLDALESIEMRFNDDWDALPPCQPIALQTARNLTKAIFELKEEVPQICPGEILLLPWSQLTEVSFTNLTLHYEDVHSVLNECSRLISCTLALRGVWFHAADLPSDEIILPTLRSLTVVVDNDFSNWAVFLHPLVLPSLKDLDISAADNLENETLISFLARSGCALETFAWSTRRARDVEPDELYLILGQLVSIQTLIIPRHCLPPAVFESLSRNEWLPEISHLACCVDPFGLQAFMDLVELCIHQSSGRIESADLGCWNGPGFMDAHDCFLDSNPSWKESGRTISLVCLGYWHNDTYYFDPTDGEDSDSDDA